MTGIIPLEKPPTKQEAEDIIKALAEQDKISWTSHSKERMLERDITIPAIKNCLEKGAVTEEPYRVNEYGGGYRITIEKRTVGKFLQVVLTLKYTQRLLIITAMWMTIKIRG